MKNITLEKINFIVDHLSAFADRHYQLRVWCYAVGPEVDFYEEALLSFKDVLPYLKKLIRTGEIQLSREQIKAILRIEVMLDTFERNAWGDHVPTDWEGEHLYIINHPYWIKISEQAQYALSLLKRL